MVPFALNKCGPTVMKMMRAMDMPDSQVAQSCAGSLESNRKREAIPREQASKHSEASLYKSLSLQKKA